MKERWETVATEVLIAAHASDPGLSMASCKTRLLGMDVNPVEFGSDT